MHGSPQCLSRGCLGVADVTVKCGKGVLTPTIVFQHPALAQDARSNVGTASLADAGGRARAAAAGTTWSTCVTWSSSFVSTYKKWSTAHLPREKCCFRTFRVN
eukprot:7204952-Prymnesium_polylepis.1